MKQNENLDPGYWVGMVMIIIAALLFVCISRCSAQTKSKAVVDTMACKTECIQKYVQQETSNGNIRIFAVYNDTANGISDLINVSKSTWEYIQSCKANNIKPSLGIRLRNGYINGLIRLKPKYVRKHEKR